VGGISAFSQDILLTVPDADNPAAAAETVGKDHRGGGQQQDNPKNTEYDHFHAVEPPLRAESSAKGDERG